MNNDTFDRTEAVRTSALHAHRRGWVPVPLHPDSKAPAVGRAWNTVRYEHEHEVLAAFAEAQALGVLLGSPSGGLIDLDIDDPVARHIANTLPLLPDTPLESGHAGAPRSHRWYRSLGVLPDTQALRGPRDDDGVQRPIVEVRAEGVQTMIPASLHPDHGEVWWQGPDSERLDESALPEPRPIEATRLLVNANLLALLAVLVKHWPGEGARHEAHLAFVGGMLITAEDGEPHRWWIHRIERTVQLIAQFTRDEEERNRIAGVWSTVDSIERGRPTRGWPSLADLMGEGPVERAKQFAGEIARLHGYEPPSPSDREAREAEEAEALRIASERRGGPGVSAHPGGASRAADAILSAARGTPAVDAPDDAGSLLDEYPDAPPSYAAVLARVPLGVALPETPWAATTTADTPPTTVAAAPSLGCRADGTPLLTAGTMSMLFGPPKSGKTWVTFALIADVLRNGGTVLIIDWENGYPEIHDRLSRMGLLPAVRSRAHVLRPGSARLESVGDRWEPGDPGIVDALLMRTMLDVRPDLVVIDALSNLLGRHGLDPNAAAGVERVEHLLTDTLTATGAAVLVVDHTGHGTSERAAGSFRKGAIVTGATFAVVEDERMGRERHGWSHVHLIEERAGWLRQVCDDEDRVATIDVDDTSPDGRTLVTLGEPRQATTFVADTSHLAPTLSAVPGEGAAEPRGERDDEVVSALALYRDAQRIIRAHPDGISRDRLAELLRESGVSQKRARDTVAAWVDDGSLDTIDNPVGRGRLVVPAGTHDHSDPSGEG